MPNAYQYTKVFRVFTKATVRRRIEGKRRGNPVNVKGRLKETNAGKEKRTRHYFYQLHTPIKAKSFKRCGIPFSTAQDLSFFITKINDSGWLFTQIATMQNTINGMFELISDGFWIGLSKIIAG